VSTENAHAQEGLFAEGILYAARIATAVKHQKDQAPVVANFFALLLNDAPPRRNVLTSSNA
jgi:hypothetical protein